MACGPYILATQPRRAHRTTTPLRQPPLTRTAVAFARMIDLSANGCSLRDPDVLLHPPGAGNNSEPRARGKPPRPRPPASTRATVLRDNPAATRPAVMTVAEMVTLPGFAVRSTLVHPPDLKEAEGEDLRSLQGLAGSPVHPEGLDERRCPARRWGASVWPGGSRSGRCGGGGRRVRPGGERGNCH